MNNRASRTAATMTTAMTTGHRMTDLICGKSGRRWQRSHTTLTYALLLIVCATLTESHCCYVFPKGIPDEPTNDHLSLFSPIIFSSILASAGYRMATLWHWITSVRKYRNFRRTSAHVYALFCKLRASKTTANSFGVFRNCETQACT